MNKSQQQLITSIINDVGDMNIATVRADSFPQVTTVSYFNDDAVIYFAVGSASQKAKNMARNNRVSITINRPYTDWNEIQGLSMGARAHLVTADDELKKAGELLLKKFPQAVDYDMPEFESSADQELAYYRLEPVVVSLLDYTKGFGHTENIEYSP